MVYITSIFTVALVMAIILVVRAVSAFATHEHYLLTPGTCLKA